jgi:hypothetical protein
MSFLAPMVLAGLEVNLTAHHSVREIWITPEAHASKLVSEF